MRWATGCCFLQHTKSMEKWWRCLYLYLTLFGGACDRYLRRHSPLHNLKVELFSVGIPTLHIYNRNCRLKTLQPNHLQEKSNTVLAKPSVLFEHVSVTNIP